MRRRFRGESEEAFSMKQFKSDIEAYMRTAEFLLLVDDTRYHMLDFLDMGDQVIVDD